ncbi:MAG: hypothetical protein JXQ96_23335 [Cyclobacteriaceae bacterium]
MAVNLGLTEALQAIQTDLSNNVGINDPSNYSKMLGFNDFIFGASNPRTINTTMGTASKDGKYKPVEIRYLPKKGNEDEMDAITDYSCARGTTRREIVETLNPTLVAGDRFTIDEAIIREGTMPELQARLSLELRDAMRNTRELIDKKLFTAASTNVGANPAASERTGASVGKGAYSTLEMLNSDGTLDADVFDAIKNDQEDNFMFGDAAIIGLNNGRKVFNRLAVGNIQSGGIDFASVKDEFGMTLFKDSWTNTVHGNAGKNKVLAMYPGLSQFYQYNYYNGGIGENTTGLSIKTTMQDPIYPITYDFHLKHDDGCSTNNPQGFYVGNLFVYFDLWQAPEEAFGEGYTNNLTDFNGTVGYNITQA